MSFQLSGRAPEIYESTMVPLWFGRWADELLNLVSLKPDERVLDVACGTGVTTRPAKRAVGSGGSVTGLDINASMLTKARQLAPDLDIDWVQSDVTNTELDTDSFDAVIAQHGYHYFPDKLGALQEFRRVLATNGRIALSIWDGHSAYTTAICAAVEHFISPEIAAKQRAQRETPSANILTQDLSEAGFKSVSVVRQELQIEVPRAAEFVPLHLGSMPIAQAFIGLPDDQKRMLIDHVEQSLADTVSGNKMIFSDAVNVVTGIK